jgi:inhibitor of the pro-sigma K processing machinery
VGGGKLLVQDPVVMISVLGGLIVLLLILGTPFKPIKYIGQGIVRILIGALFLFFLNTFGTLIDLHIPINIVTASVSGILGIPGLIALIAIEQFILP